ncbi:MAG TPA: hypothetical protein VKB12_11735 [Pyrinomonadaceae bacterium]|nr:hypothetical protein [Pyrinomonadaceae bacterium]
MRRALLLFLLLCLPATGSAMWALVPLEELVEESDIIVVGTLRGVSEHTADGIDFGEGRIEVREVIWGRVSPGDSLTLKWQNASAIACPRVEHRYNADEEGIWLLTRDGEAVNANYPGRFVGTSERRKVEAALARSPVVLRAADFRVAPVKPLTFSVVYRNVSDSRREFPAVAFEHGRLLMAPGSRLSVKSSLDGADEESLTSRLLGRAKWLKPVAVAPRAEHSVELDLRELLPSEPREGTWFNVKLALAGHPPTNEIDFYYDEPPTPHAEAGAPARPSLFIDVSYVRRYRAPAAGPGPVKRAGLVTLSALFLFPFFHRLRDALGRARLSRAAHGAQT